MDRGPPGTESCGKQEYEGGLTFANICLSRQIGAPNFIFLEAGPYSLRTTTVAIRLA